jgi:NAD(P)-dependent dehydrogenase (short-subunit alcohol dehydrogenase family)
VNTPTGIAWRGALIRRHALTHGGGPFFYIQTNTTHVTGNASASVDRRRFETRSGRIVNISSGAARGAGAIGVHYNASKAGMEGLTRGYAARLVKEGITVNAVAPSLIETDMMRGRSDLARNIPLGRLGRSHEVAQSVLMVLGNDYMTGQTVLLNGGMAFI